LETLEARVSTLESESTATKQTVWNTNDGKANLDHVQALEARIIALESDSKASKQSVQEVVQAVEHLTVDQHPGRIQWWTMSRKQWKSRQTNHEKRRLRGENARLA